MENRLVTIATLKKTDAELLKKQLEGEQVYCELSLAKAVKSNEQDGYRVKVKQKDRKKAIKVLDNFSEVYGIETIEGDIFSKEVERILVPVDFSENSKKSCEYALGIAEILQAEVLLMHAYYFPVINSIDYGEGLSYVVNINDTISEIAKKSQEKLLSLYNELKEKINKKGYKNVKLNFTLVNGNPANEIINTTNSYLPDLIIMGARGQSPEEKEYFGSIAASVIDDVKVPVLAIPESAKYKGIGRVNILYATNFEQSDYKALQKLMTLIYLFDVKISLVHIGTQENEKLEKIEYIKTVFDNLYPGYEIDCHIIEEKDVVRALKNFIDENNIDIIAMTTHKRNLITRLFYPSLTKKVLFKADIPLLVFHA